MSLLNHCYQQDDSETLRLLTAELPNWGQHTCLSLAVIANNRRFLAHPCCQILLADLWHGGLGMKSILLLDVKARISKRRMDSLQDHQYLIKGDESENYLKSRRKATRKSTVFSRQMTNFFETANLIEETLRAKSGFRPSRKTTSVQEAEEVVYFVDKNLEVSFTE
ncbi:unnamed protein product [Gongylonema pulchrum]|uniref:TRPM-like domain-containing protein n=1 Tax=Gongylonema pulchrum TaxID=637853 RepID=A0A3P7QKL4_9BILA|nr:unnamed protein product [Gongylonema pulchrum]